MLVVVRCLVMCCLSGSAVFSVRTVILLLFLRMTLGTLSVKFLAGSLMLGWSMMLVFGM